MAAALDAPRLLGTGRDPRGRRARGVDARDGRVGRTVRGADVLGPERRRAVRRLDGVPRALLPGYERARSDAPDRAPHRPSGASRLPRVCQQMHTLIAERAGHTAIAAAMKFADHSEVELERLKSERELEKKRLKT